jgi:septal ring factor EnvC (AmiA/AmiB activator)
MKQFLLMFEQPIYNGIYDKDMGPSRVQCRLIPEFRYKFKKQKQTVTVVYWKVGLLNSQRNTRNKSVEQDLSTILEQKLNISLKKKKNKKKNAGNAETKKKSSKKKAKKDESSSDDSDSSSSSDSDSSSDSSSGSSSDSSSDSQASSARASAAKKQEKKKNGKKPGAPKDDDVPMQNGV